MKMKIMLYLILSNPRNHKWLELISLSALFWCRNSPHSCRNPGHSNLSCLLASKGIHFSTKEYIYDERQLGGNSRLLFADSCQIVLFLQTSRLNQSKTIPKGQDIFKCFVQEKDKQGYFLFRVYWLLSKFPWQY